ncbi:zinc finger BED domain-containing protein 5-like [Centruroides vittatus]|uniref:zinc finger BED domain-containing protein 5-like n=1 Tax=Centruroides vittatus TaxID=120091 RepID=UPI00350F3252
MISQEAVKEIEKIPALADTISRRINDISRDIQSTLIEKLRLSEVFALQVDEATDISGHAHLISNVRYTDEYEIKEDFLFCLPLPGYTTAEEIFKVTDQYFSKESVGKEDCEQRERRLQESVEWDIIVSILMDLARKKREEAKWSFSAADEKMSTDHQALASNGKRIVWGEDNTMEAIRQMSEAVEMSRVIIEFDKMKENDEKIFRRIHSRR